jgi:lysophospholipase L1-like esterase
MRKLFQAALATLLSLLIALLLGEALVRLSSKYWLLNFDIEMWRYARTVKRVSDAPGVAHDHAPNADELLMGVDLRTDANGFRRPDAATESARKPAARAVVTLGDSVTLGWGAPEGETLAAHLERQLRAAGQNVIVYNAGIGNSNISMELARYKRDLRPLKPDWLILGFFINDAEPDPVPKRNFALENSALAAMVYGASRVRGESPYRSYLDYYQALYREDAAGWQRCQAALRELGALLRQDGVKATLLLLPEMHQPKNFGPFADIYRRVADAGRAAGFEVIDASTAFPAGPGDQFFVTPEDAHPNGAAQKLFAEALANSRFYPGSQPS